MKIFNNSENRIKCGKCSTEFDLVLNRGGCPLCGFGKNSIEGLTSNQKLRSNEGQTTDLSEFLTVPPAMKLEPGKRLVDDETKVWGSWLMFNDFFAPKFLARVLAWKMKKENVGYITLTNLVDTAVQVIGTYNLSKFKGFPNAITNPENIHKDPAVGRLVYHFLQTAAGMGLFTLTSSNPEDRWADGWGGVRVALTKEGLEFARLTNYIFDQNKEIQVLTTEEKTWLLAYLKQIDKEGYREYSTIKEVYEFLKKGHNGNSDLWEWFENNPKFRDYVLKRSKRAKADPEIFKKQMNNYARTFASTKISLLRELGVVRNKRNDYTLIGEM